MKINPQKRKKVKAKREKTLMIEYLRLLGRNGDTIGASVEKLRRNQWTDIDGNPNALCALHISEKNQKNPNPETKPPPTTAKTPINTTKKQIQSSNGGGAG